MSGDQDRRPRVAVVAMGDLGRSRRMLGHACELAASGWRVDLIGYRDTRPPSWLDVTVRVRHVPSFESVRGRRGVASLLALALVRQLLLAAGLGRVLLSRFDAFLVQVPPAFPALPLALIAARARGARVVIDWHNTTEAMLRLRIGRGLLADRVARACGKLELRLARRADAHLCATADLAGFLAARGIDARVLPDAVDADPGGTMRGDPSTIVCPSSWSEDDDLDLFLRSIRLLESKLASKDLRARFIFSGRGERRAWFEARVASLRLDRVRIETAFVPPDDYPALLREAALGLSLHRSAAGLDLPLKIVELLASGTPVCALDSGPAIRARIRERETGTLFSSPEGLADAVASLLDPANPVLETMRERVRNAPRESRATAWRRVAGPIFGNP
ncbi:MAG TPA: glycosyltransferase [Thermoanaerobaculia bacterium]|nr:glycosyltransferase [Thermoanaerobaculia bacterium]